MSEIHQLQQLNGKLATLERRTEHLQRQLDENACSAGARSFIKSELAALNTAMIAMRLHHAQVEGMPHPVGMLRELVAAVEKLAEDLPPQATDHLTELLERASVAITEFAPEDGAGRQDDESAQERAVSSR